MFIIAGLQMWSETKLATVFMICLNIEFHTQEFQSILSSLYQLIAKQNYALT
jgi:hypothetical protein